MSKQHVLKSARHAAAYCMGPNLFAKMVTTKEQKISNKNARRLLEMQHKNTWRVI